MRHAQMHVDPGSSVRFRPPARTDVLSCLVVSAVEQRRLRLFDSATGGGWDTVPCEEPQSALRACQRTSFQMAIVDLGEAEEGAQALRDLCRELSRVGHLLLVICGQADDPQEETWARQLGAWVYLPGAIRNDGLLDICHRAREIADKIELVD